MQRMKIKREGKLFVSRAAAEFPPMIIFAIANRCTNECVHCLYGMFKDSQSESIFLDFGLFKQAIDEIAGHKIDLVRLTAKGEPLLHPELIRMIRYAKEKKVYPINLTTNGVLLEEEVSRRLLESGLDIIDISIGAFSRESYRGICLRDNYEKVVNNVLRLLELKKRLASGIKVMVSIIDQKENEKEVKDFVKFWKGKVDKVLVRTYYSSSGLLDRSKEKFDRSVPRYPCPQLWKRVMITYDGKIKYCVHDWLGGSEIGDLNKGDSIQAVWRGKCYQALREKHSGGRFAELPFCKDCTDWMASRWDYGYEKAIHEIKGA